MMVESEGKGTNPMQETNSPYNDEYPNYITDPDYSIEIGIKTFAECLNQVNVKDPSNTEEIYLALQGYNYGTNYIQ